MATKITDAKRVRRLLKRAGLSQRGGARELKINERTMRHYCAGTYPVPHIVFMALEQLAERAAHG